MSGKNQLFKSGKTIRLRWNFCRSRISAGFGKSAEIRYSHRQVHSILNIEQQELQLLSVKLFHINAADHLGEQLCRHPLIRDVKVCASRVTEEHHAARSGSSTEQLLIGHSITVDTLHTDRQQASYEYVQFSSQWKMSSPHIILDCLPSLCQKLSDLAEV